MSEQADIGVTEYVEENVVAVIPAIYEKNVGNGIWYGSLPMVLRALPKGYLTILQNEM